jgi:hypothetical protein
MPKHPSIHLTARTDGIGGHRKGDHIEDEAEVNALLKGEHRHHFIRVAADRAPAAPKAAPVVAAAPMDAAQPKK